MQGQATLNSSAVSMSAQEFFCESVTSYHDNPSRITALNLAQACGGVWNDKRKMPHHMTGEVSTLIANALDSENWVRGGRHFSVAARNILPRLKAEYPDIS